MPGLSTREHVQVPVKGAMESKINWVAIVAPTLSGLLAAYGFDLTPEQLVTAILALQAGQSVVTVALRTWWTRSVTPSAMKN